MLNGKARCSDVSILLLEGAADYLLGLAVVAGVKPLLDTGDFLEWRERAKNSEADRLATIGRISGQTTLVLHPDAYNQARTCKTLICWSDGGWVGENDAGIGFVIRGLNIFTEKEVVLSFGFPHLSRHIIDRKGS